jgi:peroxin-2
MLYCQASLRARIEPELSLLIRLALYKLSIWSIGASYGAKLQDLKYHVQYGHSLPLSRMFFLRASLLGITET